MLREKNESNFEEDQGLLERAGRFVPRGGRQGRGVQRDPRRRDDVDRNLGSIKMKIPPFQGKNDPEAYLEWEKKVEMIFECNRYSEEKKVKLAAVEFTDYAVVWWDQLVTARRRHQELPIETLNEMKGVLRRRFIPNHYHRDLFNKLQGLVEGSKSVDEYQIGGQIDTFRT